MWCFWAAYLLQLLSLQRDGLLLLLQQSLFFLQLLRLPADGAVLLGELLLKLFQLLFGENGILVYGLSRKQRILAGCCGEAGLLIRVDL